MGWGNVGLYTHTLGRNDIISCKVAHDGKCVVFSATTAAPLTAPTDPGWMELFINMDKDFPTGWAGFDLHLGSPAISHRAGGSPVFSAR
jgi:hypothetical protein